MKDLDVSSSIEASVPEECLQKWEARGVSRRDFLKFCSTMTATLALPVSMIPTVAQALEDDQRPPVIWLEMQSCSGDSEAFLRSNAPTAAEIILDKISLEYSEIIMAAAGHQAEEAKRQAMEKYKGKYIAIVEGSIPMDDSGFCTVGGHGALEIVREVCGNAAATIAVGSCATFGNIPAAAPNPTGAVGVLDAVPGAKVINLPGCPLNAANLSATIVHLLTFGNLPAVDSLARPLFAYGKRIHDNCERRGHFDAGQFAEAFNSEEHRLGWCLYKLGCKGPATFHNCPTIRYNEGVSWPVMAGHGCIGCSEPQFWDTMTPFYRRLPNVAGFGIEATADTVGLGLAAATVAAFGAHGVVSAFRRKDKVESDKVVKED